MLHRYNLTLAFALSCAIGLFMLGSEESVDPSLPPVSPMKPAEENSDQQDQGSEQEAEATENSDTADESVDAMQVPEEVAFQPPFPDRTNLFQAPKRQGSASVKARGQGESAVELLGFVNVNGPKVALSIDGSVTTAAEGDTYYGIEVISIKPPAVLLKSGGQRWQATLEN